MITTKQRAALRAMANKLEPVMQVGKDGVTDALAANVALALEARELVKLSVLETSPEQGKEAMAGLVARIPGAEPVQVIGRRLVLYKRNEKEPKIVLDEGRREK